MKIRSGFVSNSSTSSFVLLVKKDLHEEIVQTFTEKEIKALNQIGVEKESLGQKVFLLTGMSDINGNDLWDYVENDLDDGLYDLFDRYKTAVFASEEKDQFACYTIDM